MVKAAKLSLHFRRLPDASLHNLKTPTKACWESNNSLSRCWSLNVQNSHATQVSRMNRNVKCPVQFSVRLQAYHCCCSASSWEWSLGRGTSGTPRNPSSPQPRTVPDQSPGSVQSRGCVSSKLLSKRPPDHDRRTVWMVSVRTSHDITVQENRCACKVKLVCGSASQLQGGGGSAKKQPNKKQSIMDYLTVLIC